MKTNQSVVNRKELIGYIY